MARRVPLGGTICHERGEPGTKTRIERLFTSIRSRILHGSFIYLAIDIDPLSLTMQDVPQIWRSKRDTCTRPEPRVLRFHLLLPFPSSHCHRKRESSEVPSMHFADRAFSIPFRSFLSRFLCLCNSGEWHTCPFNRGITRNVDI